MHGARRAVAALAFVAGAGGAPAAAQPSDPAGAPTLDLTVAKALVARARQLLDAGFPADAKQLAEEALVRSTDPGVVADANAIIALAKQKLGVTDPPPPVDPRPPVDPTPPADPTPPVFVDEVTDPRDELRAGRRAMAVHGAIMGATFAGGIGLAAADQDAELAVGSAAGAGGAVIGYFGGMWAARRWKLDESRARTIGSGAMVGAAAVGLFADVVEVGGTSAGDIGIGMAIGTVAGAAGGGLLARGRALTPGDVALMDSFALYGLVGGFTLGMAMQPAEDEAYSLNSIVGGVGGWLVAAGIGSRVDASPRRVSRMMLGALVLGGVPWLAYLGLSDDGTTADERVIGVLSSAGIVGGAYLGYRWSSGLAGDEVQPGRKKRRDVDAGGANALLRRSSDGAWSLAPVLPRPGVVDGARAWVFDLAAGAF